jgi:hypothetical protein
MSLTILQNPIFTDNDKAARGLTAESGPTAARARICGTINHSTLLKGKSRGPGVYDRLDCRGQFTVTVGTVFERSKGRNQVGLVRDV